MSPKAPPAPSSQPPAPHPNPFLERLILFLLPYFLPVCPDQAVARAEIIETLAAYGATSRSEVINAARVIAFSFAALDTLAEAREPELSPSLRLRHRSCANNLNRSCQQNERMLANRLARPAPEAPHPGQEPLNDVPDPEFHAAIQQAEASIASHRNRLAPQSPRLPSRPLPPAEKAQNDRLWAAAMINILAEMGMPVQPAAPQHPPNR